MQMTLSPSLQRIAEYGASSADITKLLSDNAWRGVGKYIGQRLTIEVK